jgi:hypothetical protein
MNTDTTVGITVGEVKGLRADFEEKLASENGREWLEGFKLFLKKQNPWETAVKVVANVITLTVTSDGRKGKDFIRTLLQKDWRISGWAKDVLGKKAFDISVTNGVTYDLVIIKGEEFEDDGRITSKIREEAVRRGYLTPPAEVAPLLREKLSDEEIERMGLLWLVVMHDPIKDSGGGPDLLGVSRDDDGRWLDADYDKPGSWWGRGGGFVFLAPQVKA